MSTFESNHSQKISIDSFKKIEKNNKCFNVTTSKNLDFWIAVGSGYWEPTTYEIFDGLISDKYCYLDIGAWIGPTALYATQLAKRAYAFELDPIAFQELKQNVAANKNADWASRLVIYNKAIASSSGTLRLGSRGSGGDSMSSVLFVDGETSWDVEAITLAQFIDTEKLQDEKLFLKIDIEGGEYELLPPTKFCA